jgi:hypothetical protein
MLPFNRLILASAKGEAMTWRQALAPNVWLSLNMFVVELLVGIATLVGLILLVVPGIVIATWFAFAGFVMLNEGLTGTAALHRSRELVRGHFVEVLGMLSVSYIISLVQVIPYVGTFLLVVASIALLPYAALRYLQLKALKENNEPAPKVSNINYALIILAVIGNLGFGAYSLNQGFKDLPADKTNNLSAPAASDYNLN